MEFALDHIELFVPDRLTAASWYRDVFGCEVISDFRFWSESSGGPLMISADGGVTKLALFEGHTDNSDQHRGFRRVAFGVSGQGFLGFLTRLPELNLAAMEGGALSDNHVVDHTKSYSIYFLDPYGYRWEVTSYDYDEIKAALYD